MFPTSPSLRTESDCALPYVSRMDLSRVSRHTPASNYAIFRGCRSADTPTCFVSPEEPRRRPLTPSFCCRNSTFLLDHAPKRSLNERRVTVHFSARKGWREGWSGVEFHMGKSLTVKRIERALRNPPGRHYDAPPNGVRGLRLDVENKRNAYCIFRYQRGGLDRVMGLGPLWKVELDEARELARAAWKLLDEGIDPIAARRAGKAKKVEVLTFRAAAEEFYEQHKGKWSNKTHSRQFLSSLNAFAFPILGDLAVAEDRRPGSAPMLGEGPGLARPTRWPLLGRPRGDGWSRSRPRRAGFRLVHRSRSSQRRQSCSLAWPSRSSAADTRGNHARA